MPYDLRTTCPLARWNELSHDHLEYAVAGLAPCVVIFDAAHAWLYRVKCAVANREFSSRCDTLDDCVKQASYGLRRVNCPGHISPLPASQLA